MHHAARAKSCLLIAVVLSGSAHAADFDVEICALQAQGNGNTAFLQVCDTWESKNQCGTGRWIVWDMAEFQGKAMYSTALTAFGMGKKVKVRMDGKSCIGSYDKTSMVRIIK